jgi:hypothetical protein
MTASRAPVTCLIRTLFRSDNRKGYERFNDGLPALTITDAESIATYRFVKGPSRESVLIATRAQGIDANRDK